MHRNWKNYHDILNKSLLILLNNSSFTSYFFKEIMLYLVSHKLFNY